MTEKPTENILIGYTKWIVKWFIIVVVVIAGLVGAGFGVNKFIESKVTMIALKCDWPGGKDRDLEKIVPPRTSRYLIKRKRFEDSPHGLYRPDSSTRIRLQSRLEQKSDKYYLFGRYKKGSNKEKNFSHRFNRKTLEVKFNAGFLLETGQRTADCTEITEKEFYDYADAQVAKLKKDQKF